MQTLGTDRDFGSHPELRAVGETGAGVDVYRCRVHLVDEAQRIGVILCDDRIRVMGAVFLDMSQGFVQPIHDFHGGDQRQKFSVEIIGASETGQRMVLQDLVRTRRTAQPHLRPLQVRSDGW